MTPDVKVDHPVGPPAANGGTWFWWSQQGDDLNNFMTRATPGAGGQSISAIGPLGDRARLGLRVHRGVDERRLDVHAGDPLTLA